MLIDTLNLTRGMNKSGYEELRAGWGISQATQAEYMDTTRSQLNMFERAERPLQGKQELRALELYEALQLEVPLEALQGVPEVEAEQRAKLIKTAEAELAALTLRLASMESRLADSQQRYRTHLRKQAAAQYLLAGHSQLSIHRTEKAWLRLRLQEAKAQLAKHNPLTHTQLALQIKQLRLAKAEWEQVLQATKA